MNLDEIRQKKLQDMMQNQQQTTDKELQLKKQISILEQNVRRHMTKDAFSRYTNIKIAHKELSLQVLILLNQAISRGQLKQINDEELRDLLKKVQTKTDFKIIHK